MISKVVVPIVTLSVIVVVSYYVDATRSYSLLDSNVVCVAEEVNKNESPHDVLFIGSSRTGSTLDPLYIQAQAEKDGVPVSIFRINALAPDLTYYNLMVRDYLNKKGKPKVVFVEMMHTLYAETAYFENQFDRDLVPYVSPRAVMLGSTSSYGKFVSEWRETHGLSFGDGNYTNALEYLFLKMVTGFYHFISNPISVFSREISCHSRNNVRDQFWVYDSLEAVSKHDVQSYIGDKEKSSPSFKRMLKNFVGRNVLAPEREYENLALSILIERLQKEGVEKIFLYMMPSYQERVLSDQERKAIIETLPGVEFINIQDLYAESRFEGLAEMYHDHQHFNKSGALLISNDFIEKIVDEKWLIH